MITNTYIIQLFRPRNLELPVIVQQHEWNFNDHGCDKKLRCSRQGDYLHSAFVVSFIELGQTEASFCRP